MLFYLPDIVCLKELCKVVVRFLRIHFVNLVVYGLVVGRSFHVANDAESHGATVVVAHQGQFELQGVILAVCIVYEHIVKGRAVYSGLYDFQSEAFLCKTLLHVFAEE